MEANIKRLLIGFSTIIGCLAFAMPTLAASDYYANADTGSDDNSCLSADEACLTIAGAYTKMIDRDDSSNIALHLYGTFTESIYMSASDVTAPNALDGLRITATDPDAMPTINGDGADYVFEVVDINNVMIDHLNITNAQMGIYIGGTYIHQVNNITVQNNQISDITSTSDAGDTTAGIYMFYTKNVVIQNNTIDGVNLTLTNGTSYEYVYGIQAGNSRDVTVRNNTVNDITITNTIAADSTFHQGVIYGINLNGSPESSVRDNTITNLNVTETTDVDSVTLSAVIYGISINNGYDISIRGNSLQAFTSTATATGENDSSRGYVYGIDFNAVQRQDDGDNMVRGNTIDTITSNATGYTVTNYLYGMTSTGVEKLMLRNNTIKTLTTNGEGSETNSSLTNIIYGVSVNSTNFATIRNTTLSDFTNTMNQAGESGSQFPYIYGMYIGTGMNLTVMNNRLSDFAMVTENNDQADYYDGLRTYGIYVYFASNAVIRNNILNDFVLEYASDGEAGNVYIYDYGIYVYRAENSTVQKNTYRDNRTTVTLNDPTGDSNGYVYSYGITASDGSAATVRGNTLKNITHTADSSTSDYISSYLYGIQVVSSPNSQVSNNVIKQYTQTGSASLGSTNLYALSYNRCPEILITDNIIRSITSTLTGSDHSGIIYLLYGSVTSPAYINANLFQNNSLTAAYNSYLYGMYFNDDASKTYILNNIVLGMDESASEYDYGIYLQDSATTNFHVFNNTFSNWNKVLSLLGGSDVSVKNNILAARGESSHVLEVGGDQVDFTSLASDYNLLYNASFSDQIVYDVDDDSAISLADWKDQYDSDRKSLNKPPKLKSNGHLKKGSKAFNRGTKTYGLSKKSLAYQLLKTDIDDHARPVASKGRVDIGADERLVKTKKK